MSNFTITSNTLSGEKKMTLSIEGNELKKFDMY